VGGHRNKTPLFQNTLWNDCSLEISTTMNIFTNTLTKKEMHKAKAASRTIQKPLLQITDEIRQEFIKKGNCNNYPSVDCESGLA